MPRKASGIYSLPVGTDNFVSNTTIESSKIDALTSDLESDANANRPIVAGGTGADTAVQAHDNLSTLGTNIASGTTTDLSAATGIHVTITGTDTITSFGTAQAGATRVLTFAGALTLTHNATSLILPGGANITTAAGDVAVMQSLGSGNWRCVGYQRADGEAVVTELSSDTSPQLGGDLDLNGRDITGTGDVSITGNAIMTSTDAFSAPGPALIFDRNSTSPADGDGLGDVLFYGRNDAGQTIPYSRIISYAVDVSDGAEDGQLSLLIYKDGSTTLSIGAYGHQDRVVIGLPYFTPTGNNVSALGSSSYGWSDLYLASGGAIDWNNGDVTLTHSSNALSFSGASNGYSFDNDLEAGGHGQFGDININSSTSSGAYFGPDLNNGQYRFQSRAEKGNTTDSIKLYHGTDTVMLVQANGNVKNDNNVYGQISDENAKSEISDAGPQLDDVMAVRLRTFIKDKRKVDGEWVPREQPTGRQLGVVAQELRAVSPGLVEEDEDGVLSVKYSVMGLKLYGAFQEFVRETRAETAALRAEIAALKGET